MRAAFRGWRPDVSKQPTQEMRDYVWGWLGTPDIAPQEEGESTDVAIKSVSRKAMELVDRAAVLVALRAVAGDHLASPMTLGAALQKVNLHDTRLMRLLSTPGPMRLEALQRALRLIDREGQAINWSRYEVGNIFNFLFGKEAQARRSANQWAADFFAVRGPSKNDEPSSKESNSPSEDKE